MLTTTAQDSHCSFVSLSTETQQFPLMVSHLPPGLPPEIFPGVFKRLEAYINQ